MFKYDMYKLFFFLIYLLLEKYNGYCLIIIAFTAVQYQVHYSTRRGVYCILAIV